ncbi:BACON domain-containing protein [Yinghuangia sp. YIM S09857]|uniref:BACON domain-containing protein n=1 Tax=Yinghuangia sp. YIM S09857 TaxID=3436929 RepID=UPI003F538968
MALARGHEKGTPEGVAELYDAYADGLFAYCRTITGDERIAGEIVHDTVVVVRARAAGLNGDAQLRALMYAVARSECVRHGGARPHGRDSAATAAAAAESGQVWRPNVVVLGAVRDRARLLPLVPVALAGVDAPEREALELSVRHGLEPVELARVLGVSERQAERLAERGREQFATCLRVHAVCVHPDQECAELAVLLPTGVVSGATLPEPIESRLRVPAELHIDSCESCAPFRPELVLRPGGFTGPRQTLPATAPAASDADVVDALVATGPARPAPLSVRAALLRTSARGARGAHGHGLVVARAVRAGRDGFPRTRRRGRAPLATAAVAAAAGLLMIVALVASDGSADAEDRGNAPVALASQPGQTPGTLPEPGIAGAGVPGAAVEAPTSAAASPTAPGTAVPSTGKPSATASRPPGSLPPSSGGPKGNGGQQNGPDGGPGNGPGTGQGGARIAGADDGGAPGAGGARVVVLTPNLAFTPGNASGTLRLSAVGGQITWSLGVSAPWVTVSRTSGTLRSAGTASVTVTWDRSKAPAGRTATAVITVGPGGQTVTVSGPGR